MARQGEDPGPGMSQIKTDQRIGHDMCAVILVDEDSLLLCCVGSIMQFFVLSGLPEQSPNREARSDEEAQKVW